MRGYIENKDKNKDQYIYTNKITGKNKTIKSGKLFLLQKATNNTDFYDSSDFYG